MEKFLFDKGNPQSADEINKLRKKVFLNKKMKASLLEKKVIATAKIRFEPRFLVMSMGKGYNNFTYQPTSSGSNFCKNMDFCIDEELYDKIATEGKLDDIQSSIKMEIIKILPVLSKQRESVENVTIDILDDNTLNMNPFDMIEPDPQWLAGLDLETETLTSHDESPQESKKEEPVKSASKPKVFIVHGHDKPARNELEVLLHRMEVKPIILENIGSKGKTIIESLEENITTESDLVIVLMTLDDWGRSKDDNELKPRTRQNVFIEMGMAISGIGREKVIIVRQEDLETPSDIDGVIYISYKKSVEEVVEKLRTELKSQGIEIT